MLFLFMRNLYIPFEKKTKSVTVSNRQISVHLFLFTKVMFLNVFHRDFKVKTLTILSRSIHRKHDVLWMNYNNHLCSKIEQPDEGIHKTEKSLETPLENRLLPPKCLSHSKILIHALNQKLQPLHIHAPQYIIFLWA